MGALTVISMYLKSLLRQRALCHRVDATRIKMGTREKQLNVSIEHIRMILPAGHIAQHSNTNLCE